MQSTLIQAVNDEDVKAVKQLLEQGANPNIYDDQDKVTPLHFIAQRKSPAALEIAALLIRAGADPLSPNEPDGQTPLEIAQLTASKPMIAILLNGAKIRG